jgi:hypothetical protein
MSDDDLSIQGTLAETTVPDLFRSVIRSSETAIVTLEGIGRSDEIYFVDGRLIYAASSDPDLGLGETLLRHGEIDLRQYNEAMDAVVVARRIGAVLVELGHLEPDALIRAVELQASQIVLNALGFRNGSYELRFTSEFPHDILTLPLATERLMLDGVRRIEHWSLVSRGIGRPDRLLQHTAGADARVYSLDLAEEETYIYGLLSEAQTVADICVHSYLSNFVTCRTIWALIATNLIEDSVEGAADEKRAAAENEFELEAMVERYNSIYQTVFGLVFQRIGDHTYDFLDRVVLHLSPNVTPYLSGMSLVNEGRVDIDQLLNNIVASGSSDQAGVSQAVLNELLYGWTVEIRKEFGAEAEAQVRAMVAKMGK